MGTEYDDDFYSTIADGCDRSARIIAKMVSKKYKPKTVLDIGCGEGYWARAFSDLGADTCGVDGDYVTDPVCPHQQGVVLCRHSVSDRYRAYQLPMAVVLG